MKQFRVGIVGYGWAAQAITGAINAGPWGQVTKVCSSRALDAGELSARHGGPISTYTDYAAMLAEQDLDVVAVCGYHRLHKDQVLAAARAGKHVICEKPLALTLADLREIQQVVREAGVQLCVCFELRFAAQFRAIKSLIDRGLLGQLHYAEVDYFHGIGPWYGGFSWYRTAQEGVSNLLLAGCHAVDIFLMCMGRDVEEVFCNDHPYQAEFEMFLESLAKKQEMPLTGLTDAARTHEVIFAADLSWREKRPVKLEELSHAV